MWSIGFVSVMRRKAAFYTRFNELIVDSKKRCSSLVGWAWLPWSDAWFLLHQQSDRYSIQYWSKSVGNTFHEPSRTGSNEQCLAGVRDVDGFKAWQRRGNYLCLDHRCGALDVDLESYRHSTWRKQRILQQRMAWVLMRWCRHWDPQFRPKSLWVISTRFKVQ